MNNLTTLRDTLRQVNETIGYKAFVVTNMVVGITITEFDEDGTQTNNTIIFKGDKCMVNALCFANGLGF